MSSMVTSTDRVYSDDCGMNDLAAELKLEMCSYLEVHDQYAMRKVSRWWRSHLPQAFLSQYVDLDVSKIPEEPGNQEKDRVLSEDSLEHALKIHLRKNTKVLVLRHVDFNGNKSGTLAKVIREKESSLIQLILKDCELLEEYTVINYWWLHPQRIAQKMLYPLLPTAKRLILDKFLIRNMVSGAVMSEQDIVLLYMPSYQTIQKRLAAGNMYKKLPIVLPRLELDFIPSVTGPEGMAELFRVVYRSFIMAVDAQCPSTTPDVLDDLVKLCSFWTNCNAGQREWVILRHFFKCLNEGVLLSVHDPTLDIADLRHLDPVTFNRLTTEILHRMYCLPSDGTVYTPAADSGYDKNVEYIE